MPVTRYPEKRIFLWLRTRDSATPRARGAKMAELVDPADGLPVTTVGEWTLEKHERLINYITISRGVRRKFARRQATYIELFCGPGRSIIEGTGERIDGSPLLAAKTALACRTPFSDLYLADAEQHFVKATCARLPPNVGRVHPFVGAAELTVDQIIAKLDPEGYHFAFLDPYKLDPLPFSIIERLARLKRMDMLIHVSVQDLQRNLRRYMQQPDGPPDRFAPGWRTAVDAQESDRNVRRAIFGHWLSLIRGLDMEPSRGIEHVTGTKRQPLYWLVLVARHDRALEFWDKIRNVTRQRRMDV
jgi:three-Cys-motif partner protein